MGSGACQNNNNTQYVAVAHPVGYDHKYLYVRIQWERRECSGFFFNEEEKARERGRVRETKARDFEKTKCEFTRIYVFVMYF